MNQKMKRGDAGLELVNREGTAQALGAVLETGKPDMSDDMAGFSALAVRSEQPRQVRQAPCADNSSRDRGTLRNAADRCRRCGNPVRESSFGLTRFGAIGTDYLLIG